MRNHSGGFVNAENIWDIGTPDRGRDGDTARYAAMKYNDHRHNAITLATVSEMNDWINERQDTVLVGPSDNIPGGILVPNSATLIRRAGDLAVFGGVLWMYDGVGVVPVGKSNVYFHPSDGVVNTSTSVEFPFNSYRLISSEATPETALVRTLVGSVVIDYSKFSIPNTALEVQFDLVASINDAQLITELPTFVEDTSEFQEGGSLSLYTSVLLNQHTTNSTRFSGRDSLLDQYDINAYASNGDEIITSTLATQPNQVVKYMLYIQRPTIDDFLSRNPQLSSSFTDLQKQEIARILATCEIQISKAAIRINTIYGV